MRVVIAPDSFKGTIDAEAAARALAEGWASERPDDEILCLPMADGGEGTLEAVSAAIDGTRLHPVRVIGPDDSPVEAAWLELPGGEAVVELACASGILHLGDRLRPESAHSYGFGQALRAASEAGATAIHAAIGGSASSDGGAGLLRALGAAVSDDDASRRDALGLPGRCAGIDLSRLRTLPPGGVRIWSDVTNPLLGPAGAVAVFGAQKGVTPEMMPRLEARLAGFADEVERSLGRRIRDLPGAGAAGGAGFGLLAWGGVVESGSRAVARLLGLPAALVGADAVITGEGRYDAQTASGKVVSEVLGLADAAEDGPALRAVVAGGIEAGAGDIGGGTGGGSGTRLLSLTELAGSASEAMRDAQRWLRVAGRRLAASGSFRLDS